jgi:chemotaxis protein histidine kinase CheA
MQSQFSSGLEPIRERFVNLLASRNEEILNQLDVALEQPAQATKALLIVEAVLHKVAGTAGTLGFDDLGERALSVEYKVMVARGSSAVNCGDVYQAIIAYLEYSTTITSSVD